jgi:hypothetical protein
MLGSSDGCLGPLILIYVSIGPIATYKVGEISKTEPLIAETD